MRIAQVAPLSESVPPQLYGGTERVVACRHAHDVSVRVLRREGDLHLVVLK